MLAKNSKWWCWWLLSNWILSNGQRDPAGGSSGHVSNQKQPDIFWKVYRVRRTQICQSRDMSNLSTIPFRPQSSHFLTVSVWPPIQSSLFLLTFSKGRPVSFWFFRFLQLDDDDDYFLTENCRPVAASEDEYGVFIFFQCLCLSRPWPCLNRLIKITNDV